MGRWTNTYNSLVYVFFLKKSPHPSAIQMLVFVVIMRICVSNYHLWLFIPDFDRHYCRNFNRGGHNPFTTVGKWLRHGTEVMVNHDLTVPGLGARCGK
jgi:hypothetical protein